MAVLCDSVTLPLEKITIEIVAELLKMPGTSCIKRLEALFELSSGQEREIIVLEFMADICSVAADAKVSPDALIWLLPELCTLVINNGDEMAFYTVISGGASAERSASSRISHVQAKTLFRLVALNMIYRFLRRLNLLTVAGTTFTLHMMKLLPVLLLYY